MDNGNSSTSPFGRKPYDRLAAVVASWENVALTVMPNAIGRLRKVERQIDVLIYHRIYNERQNGVVFGPKMIFRPLHVKRIEKFEGMMKDIDSDRTVLVIANGLDGGAAGRAQKTTNINCFIYKTSKHRDIGNDNQSYIDRKKHLNKVRS